LSTGIVIFERGGDTGPFAIIGGMDFLITRDEHGVPHVRGESEVDAWFGMGYACAWDRLFQLDYDRRRACGRWAEIAGTAAVGGDVLARRLGLAAAARNDVALMPSA
jgi:penicillin amidase